LRLGEDDNLVKLEVVKQVDKLEDLLILFQLHVVLLETMQSELRFVVNIQLERILHVHLAHFLSLWSQSG